MTRVFRNRYLFYRIVRRAWQPSTVRSQSSIVPCSSDRTLGTRFIRITSILAQFLRFERSRSWKRHFLRRNVTFLKILRNDLREIIPERSGRCGLDSSEGATYTFGKRVWSIIQEVSSGNVAQQQSALIFNVSTERSTCVILNTIVG